MVVPRSVFIYSRNPIESVNEVRPTGFYRGWFATHRIFALCSYEHERRLAAWEWSTGWGL